MLSPRSALHGRPALSTHACRAASGYRTYVPCTYITYAIAADDMMQPSAILIMPLIIMSGADKQSDRLIPSARRNQTRVEARRARRLVVACRPTWDGSILYYT